MKSRGGAAVVSARYSKFMSTLHWLMAALVILAYATSEGDLNTHSDVPTVHILLGLSVLTLTLPRLLGRLLGGVPSPLDTLSKGWARMAGIGHEEPGLIANVHQFGGNLLMGTAAVHAAFAVWHFFWLRDKTLQRMWPF